MYARSEVVNLINSWVGKNEKDGSFMSIIDIYNSYKGEYPRGIKMQYNWAWCACTWSAVAIKLGYTPIMPIEISCYYLINQARQMGCWQENDAYIPKPGDAVLYDWSDNGIGDNIGVPDHIGIVTEVYPNAGYMVITEGNYQDSVKKRTISLNGRYIRGFVTPKYDEDTLSMPFVTNKTNNEIAHEVIAGAWGSGENRKIKLKMAGYDYTEIQKLVNRILNGDAIITVQPEQDQNQPTEKTVTATCSAKKFDKNLAKEYTATANLYLRNDAGTNKKALVLIPKGTKVSNFGYYSINNGVKWLYIKVAIDGVMYVGFSSKVYLT